MRYLRVLFLVLVTTAVSAEPLQFGVPAPLTNTRYGPIAGAFPVLTTNGADFFLLFMTGGTVRITRVGDGEPRTSIPILDGVSGAPSVVWTGTHFLVVAQIGQSRIDGVLLDRNGHPFDRPFPIVEKGFTPKVATNGRTALMLYGTTNGVARMMLTPFGKPISGTSIPELAFAYAYAVASNGDGYAAVTVRYSEVRTFRFDAAGKVLSTRLEAGLSGEAVTIASDGRDYLVVTTVAYFAPNAGRLMGLGLHADGTTTAPVLISTAPTAYSPSMVWTDRYVIAYRSPGDNVTVVDVGRDAEWFGRPLSRPGTYHSIPTLATAGGRLLSAWPGPNGHVLVRDEISGGDAPAVASYGALDQFIEAVASSAAGTLFVWREGTALHAGVRSPSGEWWEGLVGSNLTLGAAAGSGDDFLVVARSPSAWLAIRLGPTARRLGTPVELPSDEGKFYTGAVWNGRRYVIAGIGGYNRKVIAIGFDRVRGAVTAPTVVRSASNAIVSNASIASDGTNALVAWEEFTNIDPLFVARLGPDLEMLDGAARHISPDQIAGSRVVWTGSEYLVLWIGRTEGVRAQRVSADGRRSGTTIQLAPAVASNMGTNQFTAATTGSGVAVLWREDDATRRLLLLRDGEIVASESIRGISFDNRVHLFDGGGRIGYAVARSQRAAPHHGGSRLTVVLAGETPLPAPPPAPSLQATSQNGAAALQWSAPAGEIDGYRVEYRIGDGAWNELEGWFSPTERATAIRLPDPNARAAFRVRAFNDAGPGQYSQEAQLQTSRRRAVR